jgi:hypothetical protein
MHEIPARWPLAQQGLEQTASSGVRPLAILVRFPGRHSVPKACIGAVRRSRPLVTNELARALELTIEVRRSAVLTRN